MKALRFAALCCCVAATAGAAEAQSRRRGGADGQKSTPGSERPPPKQDKSFPIERLLDGASASTASRSRASGRPSSSTSSSATRGFGGCNTFSATAYPLRAAEIRGRTVRARPKKSCDKGGWHSSRPSWSPAHRGEWDRWLGILVVKTQNGELKFERSI